jgi:hypothetical protein
MSIGFVKQTFIRNILPILKDSGHVKELNMKVEIHMYNYPDVCHGKQKSKPKSKAE